MLEVNQIVAVALGTTAIPLFLLAYLLVGRNWNKEKRCSEKTIGIIKRYSYVQYSGYSLPVAFYKVDDKQYKVAGPHFKWALTVKKSTPFGKMKSEVKTNIEATGPLPDSIKVNISNNSAANYRISPLRERYPVGKEVEVYYNPNKPKEAYVERYVGISKFFGFYFPMILGIVFIAISIYSLIVY